MTPTAKEVEDCIEALEISMCPESEKKCIPFGILFLIAGLILFDFMQSGRQWANKFAGWL